MEIVGSMKQITTLILLALCVFALQNVIPVAIADVVRVPGVKAGDWAEYDVAVNYTTNDPNPPVTPPPPEFTAVDYYKIEILSVVDTNVSFTISVRFLNGSEMTNHLWVDVDGGYVSFPAVVAANLSQGDAIYPYPNAPLINATLTRAYAGANREVNCVFLTYNYSGIPPGYDSYGTSQMLWPSKTPPA